MRTAFTDQFVLRPIGTALFAVGLFLAGLAAYSQLPVASLPSVDFPVVRVGASRPGADPATMAASVAAPLERRLGEIAGVNEITSSSSLGSTNITVQFDLSRKIDSAARDVQAALNGAVNDLPADLPSLPYFRKANPAAAPVLILALTSDTLPPTAVYDAADTVIAQRIAQVEGVADVTVNGAEQPAIRVRLDPSRLAAMGVALDDVRAALASGNVTGVTGAFEGDRQTETIATTDQLVTPDDFERVAIKTANGTVVRLGDVAQVTEGVRNVRAAGWYDNKPAVLLTITKQGDANVIETVDRVLAVVPSIRAFIPAGIEIAVMSDRTKTIRASIADLEGTLLATIVLVMLVVFVFLRRLTPTLAAGVTVPLSLAGTFAAMWAAGYSIDNLSLMAITISVGFVVDDAIVMIENISRNLEAGMGRLRAALVGARQIGFTVVAISLSLVAAFVPLLFMDGIVGRLFREFSLTLTFAIAVSTAVSLSVTPMICGRFMRPDHGPPNLLDRLVEGGLARLVAAYARSLRAALAHPWFMMLILLGVVAMTFQTFREMPKGFFPQDDTGLVFGFTEASPDVSFSAMSAMQQRISRGVSADPAVASTASFIGGGSTNQGRLFISLKPESERGLTTALVIDRMRKELSGIPGIRLYMGAVQDLRAGGRQGKSPYQFTLWDTDLDELLTFAPKVAERLKTVPGLVDISTDREQGGLQATIVIDRPAAARLGVRIADIDTAVNNAFGQRQVSTMYTQRNQYRVVLDVAPQAQRDPLDITRLYVPATGGRQVPLASVARIERTYAPLVVNHQGSFPSLTITYAITPDATLDGTSAAVQKAVAEMHLPDGVHADFAGDAKALTQNANSQALLIVAALAAIYIILGILYESLIHPLTILSTLPSAGLGALLALRVFGMELTIIAFIGIILLIGIVKKNGIMLIDFAIAAERGRALTPEVAIFEACLERFRPILMTTMAALLGALPLAIATGAGSELRRPLGVTIVGGLVLSQILTLYTTPIIYLMLSRLSRAWAARGAPWRGRPSEAQPAE